MKGDNLLHRHQPLLIVFLLLIALSACKKQLTDTNFNEASIEQVLATTSEQTIGEYNTDGSLLTGNLIWRDNADGFSFLNTYVSLHTATSYGITASTQQVFNGTRSFRFELRDTDPENHNGTRAEISTPVPTSNNLWYSYALYFPSVQYKPESDDEVITQWHGGGGLTPALCLRTKNDRMYLRIMGNTWLDMGQLDKDKWHTYLFHINHSSGSDGLIEIWRDGQKIVNRYGQNMYALSLGSSFHLPRWKLGVYKSDWNGSGTTSTNLRVLYFDDIKYGGKYASYEEMLPVGKITPTNGLSVSSFSLVNSATEKEVLTIGNGQTISLSVLRLEKANIRAVTEGTVSKVKFELSGKQSKTYTDSSTPFALHGDDGKGNYYYGNWNPPALGTYILKATPYDANGIGGTARTISFTIAK